MHTTDKGNYFKQGHQDLKYKTDPNMDTSIPTTKNKKQNPNEEEKDLEPAVIGKRKGKTGNFSAFEELQGLLLNACKLATVPLEAKDKSAFARLK